MAKHVDARGRDLVTTNGGGFPIKRKVRADGWTRARRQTFLNTLAATCNVTESCRAAGMALRAVYPLKARDAEFAAAWDQAIAEGFWSGRKRRNATREETNAALIKALAEAIGSAIAQGVRGWFPDARMGVDLNRVTALSEDRERLWRQVSGADFLSREEKRGLDGR